MSNGRVGEVSMVKITSFLPHLTVIFGNGVCLTVVWVNMEPSGSAIRRKCLYWCRSNDLAYPVQNLFKAKPRNEISGGLFKLKDSWSWGWGLKFRCQTHVKQSRSDLCRMRMAETTSSDSGRTAKKESDSDHSIAPVQITFPWIICCKHFTMTLDVFH